MQIQKVFYPLAAVLLVALAYRSYGWPGVAIATGLALMWLLLHFTRMMQVLKRAATRPVGYVDSAVMLNAKLVPGATLLHVIAMTRSLGQRESDESVQPEIFRWTDGTASHVTCEFQNGKLKKWQLLRPAQEESGLTQSGVPQAS